MDWATVISAVSDPIGLDTRRRMSLLDDALGLGTTITPDSAGCSVTELSDLGFHTPAASNELALHLDLAQYADGDGPCVAACRDKAVHAVAIMDVEPDYAGFAAAALSRGIHSSLSLPVFGGSRPSALNLYASSPSAFDDPRAIRIASLLARCVGAVLADHVRGGPATSANLQAARARHDLVRRAQRALVDTRGMTPEEALTWLMHRSRAEHCSIFTIVSDVLRENGNAAGDGGAL